MPGLAPEGAVALSLLALMLHCGGPNRPAEPPPPTVEVGPAVAGTPRGAPSGTGEGGPEPATQPPVFEKPIARTAAAAAFATYLSEMHRRIHPLFADTYLASLDKLPPEHPLNGKLVAVLEIVLQGDDGKVIKTAIVKSSGAVAFDIAAIDAVLQAAPYGEASALLRSADGKLHMTWEFHRDAAVSCSTQNTRPMILLR